MSIRSFLVPKHGIVPDLEKVVSPSIATAVQKELESTTCAATAEQSGSSTQKKRSPYDKTITTIQKPKIASHTAAT